MASAVDVRYMGLRVRVLMPDDLPAERLRNAITFINVARDLRIAARRNEEAAKHGNDSFVLLGDAAELRRDASASLIKAGKILQRIDGGRGSSPSYRLYKIGDEQMKKSSENNVALKSIAWEIMTGGDPVDR